MADACFTARASTREHVRSSIAKLTLLTNASGQYNHDHATTFIAGIHRILRETYNPGDPGNGMDKLCVASNAIARIKSTTVATAKTVLDEAKRLATAATAASSSGTTIAPAITTRSDAQDEADRLNLIHQAVIGAKEGAAEAISMKVGTDVTDSVLKSADGDDFRSIDDYQLEDVIAAVLQGADRPNTADVLTQLLAIIQFTFDFRKKVSANMELLRSKAGRLQSYGIKLDDTQLAIVLLANIDVAAGDDWGREFRPALQTIRRRFPYNHVHDTASIAAMLTELAGADGVRKLHDAPAPLGTAHAVSDHVSLLSQLLQQQTVESDTDASEYASAVQHDSDSSANTPRKESRRGRGAHGDRHPNHRRQDRRERSRSRHHPPNPCLHCKKFARRKPHPNIPGDRCFWNKKFKGYRAKWICDEMEITYTPRHKFTADMGGYPSESEGD